MNAEGTQIAPGNQYEPIPNQIHGEPMIGHRVFYVLPDGRYPGETRPAVIVRVWGHDCVNLQVFTDGENDGPGYERGIAWVTSATYDEQAHPRTWHYPPGYFKAYSFAELVVASKEMSLEQKRYWLNLVREEYGMTEDLQKQFDLLEEQEDAADLAAEE